MAIRMISGYTQFGNVTISPKDGIVELPEETEARLVRLGVANYAIIPDPNGEDIPDDFATADEAMPVLPAFSPEDMASDAEPEEAALESMTMAELKELADGMGISVKGLRSKAAVIAAIEAADKPPDPKVME